MNRFPTSIPHESLHIAAQTRYEDALRDVKSAIQFHLETFGAESLEG